VLWGKPTVEALAWPGAEVVVTTDQPRAWMGQKSWFRLPPARLSVFLHYQRPLRPVPAVTVICDTITLRYEGTAAERLARRAYLRLVASSSKTVVTISRYSARCIERDLGVAANRIAVVSPPLDPEATTRMSERRRSSSQADFALYVGRFGAHKNLDRLVAAFERTRFCAGGGRLVLVGGSPPEVGLRAGLTPAQRRFMDVRGWCDQDELEELMATARFLVQPSLEEGFGLPVLEAVACGLPVCVSDGGALPEITKGAVEPFPATSVEGMAAAIDRCAASAQDVQAQARVAEQVLRDVPTVGEYARRFRQVVEETLGQQ
jgi:glycosyltransferase involved in cell wall biosynthesis